MIKAILFDLDGTLIPMDQEVFVNDYLKRLSTYMAPHGYDPKELVGAIWKGTGAMVENDGRATNEEVFWEVAKEILGQKVIDEKGLFDTFYEEEFDKVKDVCGYEPKAAEAVRKLKNDGYRLILATNPIFPQRATQWRISWTGLQPEEFEYYTTYENCTFSKPNTKYYEEILAKNGLQPHECLMVGNDTRDDMIAKELGMKVFLLTKHLIHREDYDINIYPNGDLEDLIEYVKELENEK